MNDNNFSLIKNKVHSIHKKKSMQSISVPYPVIIDGLNVIIAYGKETGKSLHKNQFLIACRNVLHELNKMKSRIHIVFKNNPSDFDTKTFLDNMINLSTEFPYITFHIAYDTEKYNLHCQEGRDDYLSIYLAYLYGGYLVSQDAFDDIKEFKTICPFIYYAIKFGKIIDSFILYPTDIYQEYKKISKKHIGFKFISKYTNRSNAHIKNNHLYIPLMK